MRRIIGLLLVAFLRMKLNRQCGSVRVLKVLARMGLILILSRKLGELLWRTF